MRELLGQLIDALDEKRACIYCAVVETRGSTPQKAGAAMLVFADGGQVGTLGGGCIEAEVRQRALTLLATKGQGRCELMTFSLDDNYGWDDGLICGGRMSILADPMLSLNENTASYAYYRRYRDLLDAGQGCTEAVELRQDPECGMRNQEGGNRYLFDASGNLIASNVRGGVGVPDSVVEHLPSLTERPGPSARQGIAYLPTLPRVSLLIVGGGHVGLSVAQLAAAVDFDIWVLDDREKYASAQRFPMAKHRMIGDIGTTLHDLGPTLDASVYSLIVTRGHNHDEEALYHLAPTAAGYVGMIGSKRKIKLIYEDLLARGVTQEQLARVHAPLGVSIGSQTVLEIAVSIVAELIARRNLGTTEIPPRRHIELGTTK